MRNRLLVQRGSSVNVRLLELLRRTSVKRRRRGRVGVSLRRIFSYRRIVSDRRIALFVKRIALFFVRFVDWFFDRRLVFGGILY